MKASAGTPFLQCGSATLLYYTAEAALKFANAHFGLLLLYNKGTFIAAVPYCLYGRDLGGIQTHNLLIRSQMLYSVELRGRYVYLSQELLCRRVDCFCTRCESYESLLFDAGFLTGQIPEVENLSPAYLTALVKINLRDER